MRSNTNYKRLVIKLGTSILTDSQNHLDVSIFNSLVHQICTLAQESKEIVLVSSGAIACGLELLNLNKRPTELYELSALASLGQITLMETYQQAFRQRGKTSAQVLLTWDDFDSRTRFLHAKKTILKLLEYKSVPIINENDSVSSEEIKFGDNDHLSALVANLISADLLVILSDVDGLYDKEQKKIGIVESIDANIERLACGSRKFSCVGGMHTKLEALKIATNSGIAAILANGRAQDVLLKICRGEALGTYFCAGNKRLAKKNWIASGTKPKGVIVVDEGAKQAIKHKNKSLLVVGIVEAKGDFKDNDVVSIADVQGKEFARGISKFSHQEISQMKGKKGQPEIIHRNDLVII